ncbi:MAG: 16S rRNA (guanine(966)-N(2))-methyltransferase RsmD [Thermodesulfobacteriota bacterium]|nr:16S rRNA (guanine(966)-N(2))-methyltransferase RsmD [Thermodesulfobacteriota bacterium]
MRITGGRVKGRLLASPNGLNIRPTTDRVREAIFSIIGQDLTGLKVLDLFAGTGCLGIEALSRGALYAFFIDNSRQSINLMMKNLALCGYRSSKAICRRDLRKGIPMSHPLIRDGFDLIFLDPPYGKDLIPLLLEKFSMRNLLSPRARVVTESSKTDVLPVSTGNLEMVDTRSYGNTRISTYANAITGSCFTAQGSPGI